MAAQAYLSCQRYVTAYAGAPGRTRADVLQGGKTDAVRHVPVVEETARPLDAPTRGRDADESLERLDQAGLDDRRNRRNAPWTRSRSLRVGREESADLTARRVTEGEREP